MMKAILFLSLTLGWLLFITACAIPMRVDPSSVLRVELANAPTETGNSAPLVIAATGSAAVSGSTPSGTFAGQVVFDAGDDRPAAPPQPPAGPDWLGWILGAVAALTGGGGLAVWIARALALARQVSAAREAYAEDIEDLAKRNDPELVKEIKMRHKIEQVKQRIHHKVQKCRQKPI